MWKNGDALSAKLSRAIPTAAAGTRNEASFVVLFFFGAASRDDARKTTIIEIGTLSSRASLVKEIPGARTLKFTCA